MNRIINTQFCWRLVSISEFTLQISLLSKPPYRRQGIQLMGGQETGHLKFQVIPRVIHEKICHDPSPCRGRPGFPARYLGTLLEVLGFPEYVARAPSWWYTQKGRFLVAPPGRVQRELVLSSFPPLNGVLTRGLPVLQNFSAPGFARTL